MISEFSQMLAGVAPTSVERSSHARRWCTSVLVPSFRRPERLLACLAGLSRQSVLPTEVIVVWQADDEQTRHAAERAPIRALCRLVLLHSPEPGVVAAENLALDHATGDIVFLIDDDAVPPPQWIERHLLHYEDGTVGAVGGPADDFYADGTPFPKRAIEPVGKLTWYGTMLGNMFDHVPEWRDRRPLEVDHLVGYNLSLRRSAFGHFESSLRPYWQSFEPDACLQVRRNGFRVLFDFGNVVEHHPMNTAYVGTRTGDLNIKIFNAAYNHAFVLAKHSRWHLRAVRLAYLLAIGSVGKPGLAAFLVAVKRYGGWQNELSILWRSMRSHLEGWRDGSRQRARVGDEAVPTSATGRGSILSFATQGSGGDDEQRLDTLLSEFEVSRFSFDQRSKRRSFLRLLRTLFGREWNLVVMEGTGTGGGVALILAALLRGTRYVVSSGDAAGPFLALRHPFLRPVFNLYERVLYRRSAGFIGWTPYMVGRALTYGARRAMTAAGWAPFERSASELQQARRRIRALFGIPGDALVFGIAGALIWNERIGYCYGAELVRALLRVDRDDVFVLIAGDGSGKRELERMAGVQLGRRILLTGRVPRSEVPDYLAAMDIGSLPQSADQVGSFRYTTKLSEYLAADLPVVTGQIPLSYDLDDGRLWRLAGEAPWDEAYIAGLTHLMNTATAADVAAKRSRSPRRTGDFDRDIQQQRVTQFINDLLAVRR